MRKAWIFGLAWLAAVVAALPVIGHWQAPPEASYAGWLLAAGGVVFLALCWWIYRRESRTLPSSQAFSVAFVAVLLTCTVNYVHHAMVDEGADYFPGTANADWQAHLQNDIIRFLPSVAPHAARFLPNAVVRWLEMTGLNFEDARDLYRMLFVLLLFYAIYCFARLYVRLPGAFLAMLLVAMIYPVGFAHYAGQLTDPLAHVSFVLAFYFIATEDFPLFFTTVMIGAVAKETILVMAGYYILFHRRDRGYLVKAAALAAGSAVAYLGPRFAVLHTMMKYSDISGVSMSHIADNWELEGWVVPFLLTAGALLPLLVAGWRTTPVALKQMALYLLPVLFISQLFFSWMDESRNFMPLVFVLAVVAAHQLTETGSGGVVPDTARAAAPLSDRDTRTPNP